MNPLSGRRLTTTVTMTALVVIVGLMGFFGIRAATAPLPGDASASTQTCSKDEISKKYYVRPDDLTVSVYNAGGRSGEAGRTMQQLMDRGFHPGKTANAPQGSTVHRARVYTTEKDDAGARLVARTFGKDVKVVVTDKALGPGIDVYIGPALHGLAKDAPKKAKLAKPIVSCVQVD
ncbi:MAG: LytR C-terminal domain-containing protein [Marmoricola sp.]